MEVGKLWVELDLDLKGFNTRIQEAKKESGSLAGGIYNQFTGLKTLEGDFKNLVKPISDAGNLVKNFKDDFKTLVKPITDAQSIFTNFKKGMNLDKDAKGMAGKLGAIFLDLRTNPMIGMDKGIGSSLNGIFNSFTGFNVNIGKKCSEISSHLKKAFKIDGANDKVKINLDTIKKPFEQIKQKIQGLGKIKLPTSEIKQKFETLGGGIKEALKKVPSSFGSIGEGMTKLKGTISEKGTLIKNGFSKVFNIGGITGKASGALKLFTNPWVILAALIVAGVVLIITHWGSIQKWINQHFGGTLPKIFNQFKQVFTQVWHAVETIFTVVWTNIKNVVTQVWNYIGPTITGAVNKISAFWNQVWPQIKQLFSEVWNGIRVILTPIIAWLSMIISVNIAIIKAVWSVAWILIKDTFKTVWDNIVGVLRIAWDIISGVFKVALDLLTGNWKQAWTDIKKIFSSVWDDIGKLFSSIAQNALKWGSDIIQGIIDGITGAIKGIEKAVSGVADKIKSFLHFSRPDEGPLRDYEEWMPDFINGLGKGIDGSKNKLINSVKDMAVGMSVSLKGTQLQGAAGSGSNVNINFNGNYKFNDKDDMDYFMNQAALMVQRRR